ncbi:hypothetical protein [Nitrincola sp.]|uniref:hypothetical protein n=1 Tax=Nitrincola sp. TaxID=1926584 RepID=UPI003A902DE8
MVVSLWCDKLFVIPDRSAAALTAMDGGNAENAGAFFGPSGRGSHQSDTTTPPKVLCQPKDKLRVRCIDRSIRLGVCQYGKDASPILLSN